MKKFNKFLALVALGLLITSCGGNQNPSSENSEVSSEDISSIVDTSSSSESSSKVVPELTQAMLDVFDTEYISFDGTDEIALYDIRTNKYVESYTLNVSTTMDGEYWTATYEDGSLGTEHTLFFKNHQGLACEVYVDLMNEESFVPTVDEDGRTIPWEEAGMKNYLDELVVADFTYNEATGRYHYNKTDFSIIDNIASSANPYDFEPDDFSLIISDGEIIGINVSSEFDTTISAGHKAEQTLISTINYGEDLVEVNKIEKFEHEEYHDFLDTALNNMRNLTSYNTKVKFYTIAYGSSMTAEGYFETVTPDDLYFEEMQVATTSQPEDLPIENSAYGYHKFSDTDYNAYYTTQLEDTSYVYQASRAFQGSIKDAQPSFAFASEIMPYYSYDQETGERYYYSDENMCSVATTFYNSVGNDVNTYGIFATMGYDDAGNGFTPYIVVNSDGYITHAIFYFNLGVMYGVAEITYSDFNTATLPVSDPITFTQRTMPTSWNDLVLFASEIPGETSDDVEVNAGDYLKTFFEDENILDKMPFFGSQDYLKDTYGFGMASQYRPEGMSYYLDAITLYYDVPLDLNYTITTSLEKVYKCLEDNGFTNIGNHIYIKGDIVIEPVDSELDLLIYVYRTSDMPLYN